MGKKPKQTKQQKTGIASITDHLITKITARGFDVYVSFSNRSKSRYLEIELAPDNKITVRVSDHPADYKNKWRYRFDVFTKEPRPGAIHYLQFDQVLKQIQEEKR